jgi:DNA-directed RNA polymerase subunit RPC12/RpoP
MALPIIPHELFGVDCCGCLVEFAGATTEFVCNECGAKIPTFEVHRVVMQMESTEATCPHCGSLNQIDGLSEIYAFVCRHCGRGVGL